MSALVRFGKFCHAKLDSASIDLGSEVGITSLFPGFFASLRMTLDRNFLLCLAKNDKGSSILCIIASKTSSTFCPVFPDTAIISSRSIPIRCSSSLATLSGLAAGRSILFNTGIISNH